MTLAKYLIGGTILLGAFLGVRSCALAYDSLKTEVEGLIAQLNERAIGEDRIFSAQERRTLLDNLGLNNYPLNDTDSVHLQQNVFLLMPFGGDSGKPARIYVGKDLADIAFPEQLKKAIARYDSQTTSQQTNPAGEENEK